MRLEKKQVVVIGAGPAGLAAAVALKKLGVDDIVVLEREDSPGGILRQCIHDGFGLARFGESLSGPEYAGRFLDEAARLGVRFMTGASVIGLDAGRRVTVATKEGLVNYEADAVILAMGCRERTRGALAIPGARPSGVYTAGVAQAYMNLHNRMVGRRAVILGSGDIGMIMARRLTLEGAEVEGVYEILPHASGLPRNVAQCLDDFGIPLHLSYTVVDVRGSSRLESVTVARVDENLLQIPGTEREIPCDTLILSVGLIPENELSLQAGIVLHPRTRGPLVDEFFRTSIEGVFAAGNVLQVHDLVDFVSLEAENLAKSVARYLEGKLPAGSGIEVRAGEGIGYVLPARIGGEEDFTLSLRVRQPARDVALRIALEGRTIKTVKLPKVLPAEMLRVLVRAADLMIPAALGNESHGSESLEVSLIC